MLKTVTPRYPAALGTFDARRTPVLTTDVLVIGAGIAGAAAAIEAARAGSSVLCLSKTTLEETNSAYAQGGVAAVLATADSEDLHLADTLRVGAGLSSTDVARTLVAAGPAAVRWLEELGAEFDRRADGDYLLGREGGHSISRVVHSHGAATGAEIQRAFGTRLTKAPGITCRIGSFVRDLLMHDGRCVGALVVTDGTELAVRADAVILASGGSGQVYRETTNPIGACGDGIALGFRAGAQLADLEFVQFHPTTLYIAGASRFLVSEVVRGAGAVLRDKDDVAFMRDYHLDAELAPRDVVSRAILDRMVRTGDTHVYLDLSGVDGDPHRRFPSISAICAAFDIDIARDPIPVRPGAHYFVGGVVADLDGRTSVDGLYAVGEVAATFFHGANRLASNSLLEAAVTGRRAGIAASREQRAAPLPDRIPAGEMDGPPPRLHLDDMLYSLKSLMWRQVGLIRDPAGLEEALQRLAMWHHYLTRARPGTRQACELTNMLTVSALVAKAALARAESRGTHFRSDLPDRDDGHWCRHTLLQRADDGTIRCEAGDLLAPTDRDR